MFLTSVVTVVEVEVRASAFMLVPSKFTVKVKFEFAVTEGVAGTPAVVPT